MASQSALSDRGESTANVGDSQASSGIRNASAEAYTSSATLAPSYGDGSAGSYLPSVQVTDSAQNTSSSSGGNQTADQQTLQDFQSSNNSFSNLTSDYSTAIQDLSSGSSNSVADLANLYGSMTQANGQLLNAQNEQGSTYTNDSQLQSQLTGSDSVQGDVSNDQSQIMSALMAAANGNDSSALCTLTNDFGHFSTDTQQDVSSIASLAQNDYNTAYPNDNPPATNGGGGGDCPPSNNGGGGTDNPPATNGGGGSDNPPATNGGGGSDNPPATTSSSDTLPSFLNDGLNDQQQAGLNEMNGGNHPLEARAEGHLTNGYDEGQTALQMLENGGSTAQISTAINEAATNVRDARSSLYTSLTGNGLVRHPNNPDDPINEGLNQYPAANQEFKLAQEALQAGDNNAAQEAVTAALTDMVNGNGSVLGGLGEQLGVSS